MIRIILLVGIAIQFALPATADAYKDHACTRKPVVMTKAGKHAYMPGTTRAIKEQLGKKVWVPKGFKLSIKTKATAHYETYRDHQDNLVVGNVRPVLWDVVNIKSDNVVSSGHAKAFIPYNKAIERPGSFTKLVDIKTIVKRSSSKRKR